MMGDLNTKYFHSVIKGTRRKKSILLVQTSERNIIEDVEGIGSEILKVFEGRFNETHREISGLDGMEFNQIMEEESLSFETEFKTRKSEEQCRIQTGKKVMGPTESISGF